MPNQLHASTHRGRETYFSILNLIQSDVNEVAVCIRYNISMSLYEFRYDGQ